MYSNRGNIKTFFSLIIAFLIFQSEGLGQPPYVPPYTKVQKLSDGTGNAVISPRISPNCGGYYEFLPPNYSSDVTKPHPLIIVTHGAGEQPVNGVYNLNALVTQPFFAEALPTLIFQDRFPTSFEVAGKSYSFIVIAPQCEFVSGLEDIRSYLNHVVANYNVDISRVFLTGYSIGGSRTWVAGGTDPDLTKRFAALAPMSGGADGNYVFCPVPTTECTSNNSDFFRVVNNLAPENFQTPRVAAITGSADFNRKFNVDYFNEIKKVNPTNPIILMDYPNTDHTGVWDQAYDPLRSDFNGKNLYVWMLESANFLLPVTLTSFDARAVSKEVVLNWSTASESNSSHFSIERSSNGKDYKDIGRVNSHGNSSTPKNYKFTDNAPLSGNSYYRLKMIDRDATFKYSDVRKVSLNGSDLEFSFGPNPVSNEGWIKITGTQKAAMQIMITDLMGRTLKTMNVAKTGNDFSQRIDMGGLKAGQYILSIRGENINYTQRLIKK